MCNISTTSIKFHYITPVRLPLIRIIVPVGVLSSMLTATVPCAESFCLLLRDRDGLIGLGRNDPPGTN